MLICEGSDLVGKTSLCKALIERLWDRGYPVIPQHFGLLPESWNYYRDYLPFMNTRTIMDRFIMSEIVYGKVLRGGTPLTPELYRVLDAHLRLQGSVTVVVVATDDWLYRQIQDKYASRDEKFKPEQILKVNQGFCDLVADEHSGNPLWNGYAVDFDFVYYVNKGCGQPSSDAGFVEMVVNKYIERLELYARCHREQLEP